MIGMPEGLKRAVSCWCCQCGCCSLCCAVLCCAVLTHTLLCILGLPWHCSMKVHMHGLCLVWRGSGGNCNDGIRDRDMLASVWREREGRNHLFFDQRHGEGNKYAGGGWLQGGVGS